MVFFFTFNIKDRLFKHFGHKNRNKYHENPKSLSNTTTLPASFRKVMSVSQKLVLALNAGSSSLKASVIKGEESIVSFLAERLTTPDAAIHISPKGKNKFDVDKDAGKVFDHSDALTKIIEYLEKNGMLANLVVVGHRVVHGGSIFSDSAVVTDESLQQMASVSHLAPL